MSYTVTVFGGIVPKKYRDVEKHWDEMEISMAIRESAPRLILQRAGGVQTVISNIDTKNWEIGADWFAHKEAQKNGIPNSEP